MTRQDRHGTGDAARMRQSPLQNRVDPQGRLHAVAEKGGMMGNRGILHDAAGRIRRTYAHQAWVTCLLNFRGRHRAPMPPGRYTSLFFLDEATAFSAGHRPCGECQRARYRAFATVWQAVHGPKPRDTPLPRWIDKALHAARIARGRQVTHVAEATALPDGAMVITGGRPALKWDGAFHPWAFSGYGAPMACHGAVPVLTPAPVVAVFAAGFRPRTALPG